MAKSKFDWEGAKLEYDLGQLSLAAIAEKFGMADASTVSARAKRHGWGERPEVSTIVKAIVNDPPRDGYALTNTPRLALSAFDRVLALLHRHRRQMGTIAAGAELLLADVAEYRDLVLSGVGKKVPRKLRLDEMDTIATILAKTSQAVARLVPLERRAFGLNDQEGPSEFDGFSQVELEALMNMCQQALGKKVREIEGG